MTTAADTQIVPVSRPLRRAARRRPGRGRRPGVGPLRQHPPRLRRPVAHLHQLVRRGGSFCSAGRAPHRGPLPGRPRRLRRQHRHHAPGHLRHLQGPRVGEAGIALPGPGRARLLKGWGRSLRKPQRQSGALTADVLAVIRLTAVQPRKRGRGIETPSRRLKGGSSTWPWWRCCPTRGCGAPRLRL